MSNNEKINEKINEKSNEVSSGKNDGEKAKTYYQFLQLIASQKKYAQLKVDGKNWLHYLVLNLVQIEARNVSREDIRSDNKVTSKDTNILKAAIIQTIQKLIKLGISPYDRDNAGNTVFMLIPTTMDNLDNPTETRADNRFEQITNLLLSNTPPDYFGVEKQVKALNTFLTSVKANPNRDNHFLLLSGPPGVGKTELVKAYATLHSFDLKEFPRGDDKDCYVGKLEVRITKFFNQAKKSGSWVCLFMDEIDSLCPELTAHSGSGFDYNRVVNLIQMEITELRGSKVVLIGATNFMTRIKAAIKNRAGIPVIFSLPNLENRLEIIKHFLRLNKLEDISIIDRIAAATSGWSPRLIKSYLDRVQYSVEPEVKIIDATYATHATHTTDNLPILTNDDFIKHFEAMRELSIEEYAENGVYFTPPTLKDASRPIDIIPVDTIKLPLHSTSNSSPNSVSNMVALDKKVQTELETISHFLQEPSVYQSNGIQHIKLLLEGPPGTGKTLFAKTIADQTNTAFIYVDSTICQSHGIKTLRKSFEAATQNEKAVIFIDELDGVVHVPEATLFLQSALDGFRTKTNANLLVVIAATNHPRLIPDALLRRFSRVIVPLPNESQRYELLSFYFRKIKNIKLDTCLNDLPAAYKRLAKETAFFAASDIKEMIERAIRGFLVKNSKNKDLRFKLTDLLSACNAQTSEVMERIGSNASNRGKYPPSYFGDQAAQGIQGMQDISTSEAGTTTGSGTKIITNMRDRERLVRI